MLYALPVQVTATWAAEADAKRLAALSKCMESEPIPVVNVVSEADETEQQRGRTGAAAATAGADGMAVDNPQQQQSGSKNMKKGRKAATAAAGGVRKKRKQTAGVKLSKEFSKKQKKQRLQKQR